MNKVLVRPRDFAPFVDIQFDEADWADFPFDSTVTQIDAAEILNIDALQIRTAIDGGTLEFVPAGVALRTSKAKVLELAEQIISTSEAALRLDIDPRCVAGALNGRPGISRRLFGWSRLDFEAWQS